MLLTYFRNVHFLPSFSRRPRVAEALAEAQASAQLATLYLLLSTLYLLKLQLQTYSPGAYLQAVQQRIQLTIAALVYQVSTYVKHKQESPL